MSNHVNAFGQPIGFPVAHWTPRPRPSRITLEGRICRLEPLSPERHTLDLYEANQADDGRGWTYMAYGPFASLEEYRGWVEKSAASEDPLFYTVIDTASDRARGVAALMRIDPANGVIEVGNIKYAPALQRTAAATEAKAIASRPPLSPARRHRSSSPPFRRFRSCSATSTIFPQTAPTR